MNRELASVAAARYFGPSQPTITTSVVNNEIWASCATISGQPSVNRARNSLPQLRDDKGVAAPEAGAVKSVFMMKSTR